MPKQPTINVSKREVAKAAVSPKSPTPTPAAASKPSPVTVYLKQQTRAFHPSSRWTAIFWLAATGLIVLGSSGGTLWQDVKDAYFSAASAAAQPAAVSPGTPAVATGAPGQTPSTIGGSPIVPGSPDTGSGQLPNLGNSFPTSVGLPNVPSGAPAVGGPLSLGQWRYGRIGPGELVG